MSEPSDVGDTFSFVKTPSAGIFWVVGTLTRSMTIVPEVSPVFQRQRMPSLRSTAPWWIECHEVNSIMKTMRDLTPTAIWRKEWLMVGWRWEDANIYGASIRRKSTWEEEHSSLTDRSCLFVNEGCLPMITSFTPINPTNVLDPRWEWDKSSWRSIKSALSLFVWHCQTQLLDEKHPPVSLHLRCVFRRWWMKSKKSVQGPIQKILPRVRIKRDRSFHSLLVFVTTTMQSPIQLVTESLSRQACDHEGSFGFRRNMHWC